MRNPSAPPSSCSFVMFLTFRQIAWVEDMIAHPGEERVALARNGIPDGVERIVSPVVAVSVGGARPSWRHHDRRDGPMGQDHGIWAWRLKIVDDFFNRHYCLPSRQRDLFLDANDA